MLTSFLTVSQQVVILFLLIGVGFVCGKTKFLADTAVTGMTDFVLYIVTPCVMIQSLQREFDAALAGAFLQAVLFAVVTTFIGYFLARATLHDQQPERESVYRFAAIFSNCGFMALPLEGALLGPDGMFFGAAFMAVFNIMNWTLGLYMMSRNRQLLSLRKLITNPGIIGVTIGVILFFTSSTLPSLINAPVDYLAALNTPIPMVVIGYHLSHAKLSVVFRDFRAWLTIAERLVILPLIGLGLGIATGMNAMALIACMVALCAPVAAICTMFSVIYGQDSELSVALVSLSTLLSILTMPVIIVLTQTIVSLP